MEVPDPICEAFQARNYRQPKRIVPNEGRVFHIRVQLQFIHLLDDTLDLEFDEDLATVTHEDTRVFPIHADRLLRHRMTGEEIVWDLLEEIGIPHFRENEFMVERILSCASSMAGDERNRDLNVLPMHVFISCIDRRDEEGLNAEGMDDDDLRRTTVSASKSSVEQLKTVRVAGSEEINCGVCLDEIVEGGETRCMPCSHIYHGECIVKWLENSIQCPLCRFELRNGD